MAHKWWLQERQRRQYFGTLQIIGGLLVMGVGSSRAGAEAPELRLSSTAAQALLAAARGSTFSGPHVGSTQRMRMVGSFVVAYLAP